MSAKAPGAWLNEAGTSWPKPPEVLDAAREALELAPWESAELVERARGRAAAFLSLPSPERLVFTPSCTAALALAIHGLAWREGDALVTSAMEHEAVAAPARALARSAGVQHALIPRAADGPFDLAALERRLDRGGVRLVAVSHASNVTGELLPIERIVELAHAHGAFVLLDAAQTVGVLPVDAAALGVDALAFAGHKGPRAPTGVGGLWVGPGPRLGLAAGSCADTEACPADPAPSWCEVGSAVVPAIAGLEAGLAWIEEQGLGEIAARRDALVTRLLEGLEAVDGLRVVAAAPAGRRTGALSVVAEGLRAVELERRLREEHGLHARGGEHCAPMALDSLDLRDSGTLRVSLGPLHEEASVDRLLDALAREATVR